MLLDWDNFDFMVYGKEHPPGIHSELINVGVYSIPRICTRCFKHKVWDNTRLWFITNLVHGSMLFGLCFSTRGKRNKNSRTYRK